MKNFTESLLSKCAIPHLSNNINGKTKVYNTKKQIVSTNSGFTTYFNKFELGFQIVDRFTLKSFIGVISGILFLRQPVYIWEIS